MVSQQHSHDELNIGREAVTYTVPVWSKVFEPIVALIILWVLYSAATQMFN